MTENLTETREAWLRRAIEIFRPRFAEIGFALPEKVRISIGFGSKGARQENSVILGVTYRSIAFADGVNEVFISPVEADTAAMLVTVVHELIHVALDCEDGHSGRFKEAALKLGFEAPMTSTPAGPALAAELIVVAEELGTYPGSHLDLSPVLVPGGGPIVGGGRRPSITSAPPTQTTRYRKRTCQSMGCDAEGYTVRVTAKWLEVASPRCPVCDTEMAE